jgi:hypothetical protein
MTRPGRLTHTELSATIGSHTAPHTIPMGCLARPQCQHLIPHPCVGVPRAQSELDTRRRSGAIHPGSCTPTHAPCTHAHTQHVGSYPALSPTPEAVGVARCGSVSAPPQSPPAISSLPYGIDGSCVERVRVGEVRDVRVLHLARALVAAEHLEVHHFRAMEVPRPVPNGQVSACYLSLLCLSLNSVT